ncbi:MAG: ABC transporter permease [Geminicoccaceae bacterium]|nr:ABC transporter permease [Geminicoccaceae bacterium]MDW8369287.1 ABC transporter permease [Geminicoccaceae bacterium]
MSTALLRFARARAALAALLLLALFLLAAAAAAWLWPIDPDAPVAAALLPPLADPAHPLGTDRLGRDLLARLLAGARTSLLVATGATTAAVLVGVAIGLFAGAAGGLVDESLMRLVEAFQIVPGFLLALALVSVFGARLETVVLAIAAASWPAPARLVRAEVAKLRRAEFVQAARVAGLRWPEVALREILPNALPPVVPMAALTVAAAILIEGALAFLGLSDPNRPSWGAMIAEGRAVLVSAPWLSLLPGMALAATVLAVNLVGEGLAEALAPRRAAA